MKPNNQPITRTELHQLRAILLNQQDELFDKFFDTLCNDESLKIFNQLSFLQEQISAIESRLNQ